MPKRTEVHSSTASPPRISSFANLTPLRVHPRPLYIESHYDQLNISSPYLAKAIVSTLSKSLIVEFYRVRSTVATPVLEGSARPCSKFLLEFCELVNLVDMVARLSNENSLLLHPSLLTAIVPSYNDSSKDFRCDQAPQRRRCILSHSGTQDSSTDSSVHVLH